MYLPNLTEMYPIVVMLSRHFTKNLKCQPYGGARKSQEVPKVHPLVDRPTLTLIQPHC